MLFGHNAYRSKYIPSGRNGDLGVAIDLGTTHICIAICDLFSGERVLSETMENPQSKFGSEIITRLINVSSSKTRAKELQDIALDTIATMLRTLSQSVDISKVVKIVFVANSAMLSILVDSNFDKLLDPNSWAGMMVCKFRDKREIVSRLELAADCEVEIIQPLGGFVGSDLLAGLISEHIFGNPKKALLIDFGTNSEIALWSNGHFLSTSAAGGPAFEGGGILCGMHALPGAIYKLGKSELGEYGFESIGNQTPIGLCGSALVDALAIFVKDGLIAKNGRIKNGADRLDIGSSGFYITPSDIDALQRAKSAIRSGIETLCKSANISTDEIEEYYVCGAFGEYINTEHAEDIGLLPKINNANVKICGNTALNGAQDMLVSNEAQNEAKKIRENLTVINLAGSIFFEDSFFKHLFF